MSKKMISVVVPAFNEEDNLPLLVAELVPLLTSYGPYEIIIVNDGSSDGTEAVVQNLHQANPCIHLISFARNFGHQYALKAGLDHARGDCVISMDADLQHPVSLLPDMIREWQNGYDIVYTIRRETEHETWFKKTTSRLFYHLFNFLTGLRLPAGAADFRLLDRKVVDQIRLLPERMLFLRGMISWMGYRQKGIEYTPAERRHGVSHYTLSRMLSLARTGAVSFSLKPLRLAIFLGLLVAFLGCLFTAYVIYMRLFNGEVITGWASLMSISLILGGAQLFVMGIIGEYIGMIFLEAKHRPQYIISNTTLTCGENHDSKENQKV